MNQPTQEIQQARTQDGLIPKLTNFLLFQSVWLITVLGAARGLTWPGMIAIIVFASIQGWVNPLPKTDFILLGVAVIIGFVCDSVLVGTEVLRVTTAFPVPGLAPLWMLVLWANLALAVNHCLGWLHHRYWLAAIFGAAGGPVAYIGGAALGAGEFAAAPEIAIALLVILWSVVTPGLFWMAAQIGNRAVV